MSESSVEGSNQVQDGKRIVRFYLLALGGMLAALVLPVLPFGVLAIGWQVAQMFGDQPQVTGRVAEIVLTSGLLVYPAVYLFCLRRSQAKDKCDCLDAAVGWAVAPLVYLALLLILGGMPSFA